MSAYAGIRVVDFSQGVAGPIAAMLLGDFGAEVIKVEPPGGGRLKEHPGYQVWNRNKQVLTLDLAAAGDLVAARDLITRADVVLFDDSPGSLEELGLDGPSLTAAHSHLVHVWMPPYGTTGFWSGLPPHHSLLSALTGMAFRQGAHGDTPIHLVLPLAWYGQGVTGAAAIGAALLERTRSGRGQAVVVSGLHGMSEVTGPVRALQAPPLPRGAPQGASPSYRLYQCADGEWFFLGTLFANFYRLAIAALGYAHRLEDFLLDPFFAREALQAIFRTRPRADWLLLLQTAGVPCAPVGRREAWFAGEVVAEAGLRKTFSHPTLGEVSIPNVPVRLTATPGEVKSLAQPIENVTWPERSVDPSATPGLRDAPLAGIRVLDLGTVIAGAHAGGILANLGADVIKVEPAEGDPFRSYGGGFLAYSRGKRGLGIDLKQAQARELFFDLVRQADVVLDNYRFGVRERLGIGYEALRAINPRIVSCSINAYGKTGARAERPGFDPLLQAEGGMMAAQGGTDEPVLHTIPVNDVATAAIVAFGVVTALKARERTGEGQEVITSLMAQSMTFQLAEMVDYAGRPPNDVGDRDCVGLTALHRFYPCGDGWIAIVCEDGDDAMALAATLDIELSDPAAALAESRNGELATAIAQVLADWPLEQALVALLGAGVPCAPCLRGAEAMQSEWLWENGVFEIWDHPLVGPVLGVCGYADFSAASGGFTHPTPELGEHSVELAQEAGWSTERIEALLAAGAIFEPIHSRAHLRDGGGALATQ
jgi:crotonobetainyl-CoA:carnitine CoA-transferase CaiB-like acyl-CoA transferase